MSENNNIENFDNFFREAFNSFEPPAPQGVWEGIQSQVGTTTGAGTGAGTIAKWTIGKIIVGAVTAVAVATTIYFTVQEPQNPIADNKAAAPANTETVITTPEKEAATTGNNSTETTSAITAQADKQDAGQTTPVQNGDTRPDNNGHQQTQPRSNGGQANSSGTNNSTTGGNDKGTNGAADITPPAETSVNSLPKGPMVKMYLSDSRLCTKEEFSVTFADDITKTTYRVNFGDGTYANTKPGQPLIHSYSKKGSYKVTAAEVGGPKTSPEIWVQVFQVKAAFTAKNIEKATYAFTNNSQDAVEYSWFFGDNTEISHEFSPVYAYKSFEAQEYKVKLLAVNEAGCIDSFSLKVKPAYLYEDIKPIIPNVFSPNGDGINDRFEIGIANEENYHLLVYDRGGNKVFESTSKENTWDGKNMYTGEVCDAATYVMVFTYKIKGFAEKKENGTIAIKR